MKADKYIVTGEKKVDIRKLPTNSKEDGVDKEEIIKKYEENKQELFALQDKFYADAREGLIVVIQALDASGKDSTIKNVFSGMNPQGVKVHYYKAPTSEELAHDYLWRVNKVLPKRGEIAIFNRSHYEDLITAEALHLKDTYEMAPRVTGESEKKFIERRIRQVKNYEEYLYENSYRIVKVFLHISKEEQKKRFLERIERPDKNWKFEPADLKTREQFDEYMSIFERVITKTATKESPWYVLPADDKWYTRYLFSEILIDAISKTKPEYPSLPDEVSEQLSEFKKQLENS